MTMKNYMALLEFVKNQVFLHTLLNASKVGATTTSSGNEFQVDPSLIHGCLRGSNSFGMLQD